MHNVHGELATGYDHQEGPGTMENIEMHQRGLETGSDINPTP